MSQTSLEQPVFYEAAYLARYEDARTAVRAKSCSSGFDHWTRFGKSAGHQPVWVVPSQLDSNLYLMHYPAVRAFLDAKRDPEVTSAAAHFRRYGNRNGLFFFQQQKQVEVDRVVYFNTYESKPCDFVRPDIVRPLDVERIAVLTCFYNPCGYNNLVRNFNLFSRELELYDVDHWNIELSYDGPSGFVFPQSDRFLRVEGNRGTQLLWQKERLLNLLLDKLPDCYEAFCWIDADVHFCSLRWVDDLRQALRLHNWCQLFENSFFTQFNGSLTPLKRSVGWHYVNCYKDFTSFGKSHPGFAWAARTEWFRQFGFLDTNVIGGGDVNQIKAISGDRFWVDRYISKGWLRCIEEWGNKVRECGGRSFTYIPGDIVHMFHGSRSRRNYLKRWLFLSDYNFNPRTDIDTDAESGLLQWSESALSNKPEMVRKVAEYFSDRQEDKA